MLLNKWQRKGSLGSEMTESNTDVIWEVSKKLKEHDSHLK